MIIGSKNNIVLGVALLDDSLQIDDNVLTIFSRNLDLAFVGKVPKTTGADDRFADSVNLIRWNLLRSLSFNGAINVNPAPRFVTYPVDRQDDRSMVVIFPLQRRLNGVSKLSTGSALSGDEANIRHFEFAIIIDSKVLRFVITILNHSEANEIIRTQALLVVKHCHGVSAHNCAAGRARKWLFDGRRFRGVLKGTAFLRNGRLRDSKN